MLKDCELVNKKLCTGCTGLGEQDWIGKEACPTYQKYNNKSGYEICKNIIEGIQQKI